MKHAEDYTQTQVADIVSRERAAFALELLVQVENDISDIMEMGQKHAEIMSESKPLDRASQRAMDVLETRIEVMRVYVQDNLRMAIKKLENATDWYARAQAEMLQIKLDYLKQNIRTDCLDFCIDGTFQLTLKAIRHYCHASEPVNVYEEARNAVMNRE